MRSVSRFEVQAPRFRVASVVSGGWADINQALITDGGRTTWWLVRQICCLSQVRLNMRILVLLLLSGALASCGTMGHWEKREDLAAPLLLDGKRSVAFWRCALVRNTSGGPCQVGFTDHNGKMILLEEIESELEAYVPNLNLKPPYQFFVLTISPTVVMYVPGRPSTVKQCGGENYRAGCFATPKIPHSEFQYGPQPEIAKGSLIFAPSFGGTPAVIPDESRNFEFALPDSALKLTADGVRWNVSRIRKP